MRGLTGGETLEGVEWFCLYFSTRYIRGGVRLFPPKKRRRKGRGKKNMPQSRPSTPSLILSEKLELLSESLQKVAEGFQSALPQIP